MKHYQRRNGTNFCNSGVSESNGPCGKIRGSIQQILEKYEAAFNENVNLHDDVKTQSMLQHTEHYRRINNFKKERKPNEQHNNIKHNLDNNSQNKENNPVNIKENNRDKDIPNKEAVAKETTTVNVDHDAEIASEIFGSNASNNEENTQENQDVKKNTNNKRYSRKKIIKKSPESTINIDSISYLKQDITDTIDKLEN